MQIELKENNTPKQKGWYIAQIASWGCGLLNGRHLVDVAHDCDDIGDAEDTSRLLVVHWWDGHTFPVKGGMPKEARWGDRILWSDRLVFVHPPHLSSHDKP